MRVLQLGPFPPPHGGVQTNLVSIRDFLLEKGFPSFVINLTRHRKPEGDGIFYPKSALRVFWLLWRLPYDIVHLHIGGNIQARMLGLALFCCLIAGRKSVLTFHSGGYPSSPEGQTAGPRTLRGFVFRRFDRIIAVNQAIVDLFLRFGVRPERIRLIEPHSVPDPPAGAMLPAALGTFYEQHSPVLLTVGLLEPEYDLPLQMDVLQAIREKFPNAGLVIIGSGSLDRQLETQRTAKPYAEHILLAGDVPHASTLAAIKRCDVFLRTSLYDGDSVAVREALHFGVPVVATDTGLRPPGVTLFPISDRERLQAAIEQGLTEASTPMSDSEAQSTNSNIQAVFELYRELIAED